jgi:hypothetical protein
LNLLIETFEKPMRLSTLYAGGRSRGGRFQAAAGLFLLYYPTPSTVASKSLIVLQKNIVFQRHRFGTPDAF